jgi:hypothetical protein
MPPVVGLLGVGLIAGAAKVAVLVGATGLLASAITLGVTVGGIALLGSLKKATQNALARLNLTFDPDAPRKIWFGETAGNTDILYQEAAGTDQEFIDMVIATAAHRIDSYASIYIEDKLAWTASGGVQGIYVGYLTVTDVTVGVSGAGTVINTGSIWGANSSLTGCAYLRLRIRRSGLDSKASSPFVSGLPGRLTVIGKGARVYDPRRDSTAGGSGSHRANDESTWQWADGSTVLGTNPALQVLSYLIGYRIGGVLSVGMGLPINRINMADFIAAANVCDEDVAIAAGGNQKRYQSHGVFTDADDHKDVLAVLCQSMNAKLRDTGGRIGIRMMIDDTAGSLLTFTEEDILGPHEWQPNAALNESYNVVRGRFVDPSAASLYQMTPYGARSVASPDGINRTLPLDLPLIQDAARAQRVAEQTLNRAQYRGQFKADFGPRAWACEEGQPVRLTFGPCGFTSKLFRVVRQELKIINTDDDAQALCPMVLVEDDPSIYSWTTGDENAVPAAVAAVSYLPTNQPFIIQQGSDINVENGATRGDNRQTNWDMVENSDGYNVNAGQWERVAAPDGYLAPFVWRNTVANMAAFTILGLPRVEVVPGDFIYVRARVRRTASFSSLTFVVNLYEDMVNPSGLGSLAGTTLTLIPTANNDTQTFEIFGQVPQSARAIEVWIENLAGATVGTVFIGDFRVSSMEQGAGTGVTPRLELPASQTFNAAFDGTINAGQQPRNVQIRRFRGQTDVSSSTSWGATGQGCTASINSSGVLTINNVIAPGRVDITGARDGVTLTGSIETFVDRAGPPASSGSPTANGNISFASDSTSFVTAATASVTTTSSGTQVSIASDIYTFGDAGFAATEVVWQRETSPGTWADIGATVVPDFYSEFFGVEFGYASVSRTVTGLASSTTHNFRLRVRRTTAPVANQNYSGSFTLAAT